jgi:hypothetical protein
MIHEYISMHTFLATVVLINESASTVKRRAFVLLLFNPSCTTGARTNEIQLVCFVDGRIPIVWLQETEEQVFDHSTSTLLLPVVRSEGQRGFSHEFEVKYIQVVKCMESMLLVVPYDSQKAPTCIPD